MAAQNVELTQREVELIEALVKEGVYADANEAIHDGLRRIEQERRDYSTRLETLRGEVTKGFDDLDQGRYTDIDGHDELTAHLARLSDRASQRVAGRRATR